MLILQMYLPMTPLHKSTAFKLILLLFLCVAFSVLSYADVVPRWSQVDSIRVNEGEYLVYNLADKVSGNPQLSLYHREETAWLSVSRSLLSGQAPQVSEETSYTITIRAFNNAGSSEQTFTVVVKDVGTFVRDSTTPSALCPVDVRVCPDGSKVFRSGELCEFAPCPSPLPTNNGVPTYSSPFSRSTDRESSVVTVNRFGRHLLVLQVQQLLNKTSCKVATTGPGSPGSETDYFGPATDRALLCDKSARNTDYSGTITQSLVDGLQRYVDSLSSSTPQTSPRISPNPPVDNTPPPSTTPPAPKDPPTDNTQTPPAVPPHGTQLSSANCVPPPPPPPITAIPGDGVVELSFPSFYHISNRSQYQFSLRISTASPTCFDNGGTSHGVHHVRNGRAYPITHITNLTNGTKYYICTRYRRLSRECGLSSHISSVSVVPTATGAASLPDPDTSCSLTPPPPPFTVTVEDGSQDYFGYVKALISLVSPTASDRSNYYYAFSFNKDSSLCRGAGSSLQLRGNFLDSGYDYVTRRVDSSNKTNYVCLSRRDSRNDCALWSLPRVASYSCVGASMPTAFTVVEEDGIFRIPKVDFPTDFDRGIYFYQVSLSSTSSTCSGSGDTWSTVEAGDSSYSAEFKKDRWRGLDRSHIHYVCLRRKYRRRSSDTPGGRNACVDDWSPVRTVAITACNPVDGGWSEWSDCTCTPDDNDLPTAGEQTRTCTNPAPICGGTCSGESSKSCAISDCPVRSCRWKIISCGAKECGDQYAICGPPGCSGRCRLKNAPPVFPGYRAVYKDWCGLCAQGKSCINRQCVIPPKPGTWSRPPIHSTSCGLLAKPVCSNGKCAPGSHPWGPGDETYGLKCESGSCLKNCGNCPGTSCCVVPSPAEFAAYRTTPTASSDWKTTVTLDFGKDLSGNDNGNFSAASVAQYDYQVALLPSTSDSCDHSITLKRYTDITEQIYTKTGFGSTAWVCLRRRSKLDTCVAWSKPYQARLYVRD